MAEDVTTVIQNRDDFYRDSFTKVVIVTIGIFIAIVAIIALSIYLYLQKPPPVLFKVYKDWRVQDDIPLTEPYLSSPDMLQWVSNTLQTVFVFDFLNYNDQLKSYAQYFTKNGFKVFQNQLNNYANYNNVQNYKLFINGVAAGAPIILNRDIVQGRYGWWVQMPITINSVSYNRSNAQTVTLQVLVVRVSTMDNLNGVAIDNVIAQKNTNSPGAVNGTT